MPWERPDTLYLFVNTSLIILFYLLHPHDLFAFCNWNFVLFDCPSPISSTPTPPPLATTNMFSASMSSFLFCFVFRFHLHKYTHTIFVFLRLSYFPSTMSSVSIHIDQWQDFILFCGWIILMCELYIERGRGTGTGAGRHIFFIH